MLWTVILPACVVGVLFLFFIATIVVNCIPMSQEREANVSNMMLIIGLTLAGIGMTISTVGIFGAGILY